MEDFERYGDYDEVDDEPGEKRGIVGLIIKILIGIVCLSVVGVVGFRIFIFNSYPDSVSGVIYSDALRDYYDDCGGNMNAYTQPPDIMYDDPAEGNFFFDKLVYIPDANHIQFSIRYNTSLMTSIKEKYGVVLNPDADPMELFDFKLVKTRSDYIPPEDGTVEVVPVETASGITKTMAPRDSITLDEYDADRPVSDVHDYYRNFTRTAAGKEESLIKLSEVRRVLRVMESAFESAEKKQYISVEI